MTDTRQRFSISMMALVVLGGPLCAPPSAAQAPPVPATGPQKALSGKTAAQTAAQAAASRRLDGVWQMVAQRGWQTGSAAPGLTDIPKEKQTRRKFITAGHFLWYTSDPATKGITEAMSGTCALTGNTYQETVEGGLGSDYTALLGKTSPFTVKTEGDRMDLSGTLTFGGAQPVTLQIEEVWERAK